MIEANYVMFTLTIEPDMQKLKYLPLPDIAGVAS